MTNATDALLALIAAVRDLDLYNGSTDSVRLKDRLDELCDAAEQALATPAGSASGEDGLGARTDRLIRLAQANEKIEALQAEVARWKGNSEKLTVLCCEQVTRAETAEAALAEARRDAERYRWLRDPQPPSARWSDAIDALLEGRAADADAAIDAAMGSANGQG